MEPRTWTLDLLHGLIVEALPHSQRRRFCRSRAHGTPAFHWTPTRGSNPRLHHARALDSEFGLSFEIDFSLFETAKKLLHASGAHSAVAVKAGHVRPPTHASHDVPRDPRVRFLEGRFPVDQRRHRGIQLESAARLRPAEGLALSYELLARRLFVRIPNQLTIITRTGVPFRDTKSTTMLVRALPNAIHTVTHG